MKMDLPRLLKHLVDGNVDFVVIGGVAAVVLGVPYVTQDIDLSYNPEPVNVTRLERALLPLHPRLRVQGLTDEEAQALPFHLDARITHNAVEVK